MKVDDVYKILCNSIWTDSDGKAFQYTEIASEDFPTTQMGKVYKNGIFTFNFRYNLSESDGLIKLYVAPDENYVIADIKDHLLSLLSIGETNEKIDYTGEPLS